ncbi:MAG: hypothetical protein JWO24_3201 [Rhodospirillales bacterium]|jgi:uncharacterized lipoprotein YajG|nr:hypothetical protein [Rhodospirillales bacterium]
MRVLALLSFMLLSACGATQMPLTYRPSTAPAADARPIVEVADVVLSRNTGREDPVWVGTLRGGYGNPLKQLHADRPVNQVMQQALRDGLRARGLLVSTGDTARRRVSVNLTQFDANQYMRREATVAMTIAVDDTASGQTRWRDSVRVYEVDGSIFGLSGVLAPIEDLHALMQRVLQQAVDQALDNLGFRAALRD